MDPNKPIDFENVDSVQHVVQEIVKSPDPKGTALELLGANGFPKLYESVNKFLEENPDSIQIKPEEWGRLTSIFAQGLFDRNGGPLAKKRPLDIAKSYVTVSLRQGFELETDQIQELEKLTGCEFGLGADRINIFAATAENLVQTQEYIGQENIAEVSEPQTEAAEDVEAGEKENKKVDSWLTSMESFGQSPDQVWADGNVLYSYQTTIAKRLGDKLYLNETKYSKTTGRLTKFIADAAKQAGLEVHMIPESFFGTEMERKLSSDEVNRRAASVETAVQITTPEEIALYAVNVEELYNALESCKSFQEFEDVAVLSIEHYNQAVAGYPEKHFDGDQRDVAQALMEIREGGEQPEGPDQPGEEMIEIEDPELEAEIDSMLAALEGTAVVSMEKEEILAIVTRLGQKAVDAGLVNDLPSAELDAAEALYLWLSHNHEGQNSEEYEMLSALVQDGVYKPRQSLNDVEDLGEDGQYLYNDMESLLAGAMEQPAEEAPAAPAESAAKKPGEITMDDIRKPGANVDELAKSPNYVGTWKDGKLHTGDEGRKVLKEMKEEADKEDKSESAAEESEPESGALEKRLEDLERKRDEAHDAGDLRRADRYDKMLEDLVEECAEGVA